MTLNIIKAFFLAKIVTVAGTIAMLMPIVTIFYHGFHFAALIQFVLAAFIVQVTRWALAIKPKE